MKEEQAKDHLQRYLEDTAHLSSVRDSREHPSYKKLKEAGETILPVLLRELKDKELGVGLFGLLCDITNANPVDAEHRGHIPSVRDDWLEWGRANGYID